MNLNSDKILRTGKLKILQWCSFVCLTLLFVLQLKAQDSQRFSPLVNSKLYKSKGWFYGLAATRMIPNPESFNEIKVVRQNGNTDTLLRGAFQAKGKLGIFAEIGRHHFTNKFYFFHHFDYGIALKLFRGRESFNGWMNADQGKFNAISSGKFSEFYASAFANASNIVRLSESWWMHNSLGLNFDFNAISMRSYSGPTWGMSQQFSPKFLLQFHYRLGFGYKLTGRVFLMPFIEVPVVGILPFESAKANLREFSSTYKPVIFGIRILTLGKQPSRECIGVPSANPVDIDKEKPGKHKNDGLFGPDVKMKKMRRK
jgi:hypothetical protein